ncbi:unnamed protein product [Brassicogethes aeneus]|uniref:nicotinamidase n=1 Tax=Brassicogethes aeneus TaxID=1431903 RepID=A0A9P0AQ34_BRAAE|nr:unnamed protein product [Brassicogethes aeneus]
MAVNGSKIDAEKVLRDFLKKHKKTSENAVAITKDEFVLFCREIYGANHESYPAIFDVFCQNKDEILRENELQIFIDKWLSIVLNPVTAIIIVDVQNDFISGTLALKNCPANQDGADTVLGVNKLLATVKFDKVFYSLDWHPKDHISFYENRHLRPFHESSLGLDKAQMYDKVIFEGTPPTEQILWPTHCIQGTWGSELHKDLLRVEGAVYIKKGVNSEIDSYSAFWDNKKHSATDLSKYLKKFNITDLYVCGLAYDVCVGSTALDSMALGFRTILIEDCCKGVTEQGMAEMKNKILSGNGIVVSSKEVNKLLDGSVKRPELGYFLAKHLTSQK